MEVIIKIQAPELAHAIETLAIAIGCTVDKIGVGEAITEAVTQGPEKVTEKATEVTEKAEKITKAEEKVQEEKTDPAVAELLKEDGTEEDPPITIEEVRAAFVKKNSKTNSSKLKAILKKFKVVKVTDLPEDSFSAVLTELEAI